MLILHTEEKEDKLLISKKEFELLLNKLKEIDEVKVINDESADMLETSSSSLEFWNNEIDDKVWNNA
ncbi:MAG: DUF2281 domain-containing protein [Candidatus Anammoxibacter sp.]